MTCFSVWDLTRIELPLYCFSLTLHTTLLLKLPLFISIVNSFEHDQKNTWFNTEYTRYTHTRLVHEMISCPRQYWKWIPVVKLQWNRKHPLCISTCRYWLFVKKKLESSKENQLFYHNRLLHVVKQVLEAMFKLIHNLYTHCR